MDYFQSCTSPQPPIGVFTYDVMRNASSEFFDAAQRELDRCALPIICDRYHQEWCDEQMCAYWMGHEL